MFNSFVHFLFGFFSNNSTLSLFYISINDFNFIFIPYSFLQFFDEKFSFFCLLNQSFIHLLFHLILFNIYYNAVAITTATSPPIGTLKTDIYDSSTLKKSTLKTSTSPKNSISFNKSPTEVKIEKSLTSELKKKKKTGSWTSKKSFVIALLISKLLTLFQ